MVELSSPLLQDVEKSFVGIISLLVILPPMGIIAWCLQKRWSSTSEPLPFTRVVHSRFRRVSPLVLCCIRLVFACYCLGVFLYAVAGRPQLLFFFTVWNWIALTAYFFITGLSSLFWLRSKRLTRQAVDSPVWWKLATLCQSWSSLVATNVWMVDVILWAVLFPATPAEGKLKFFYFANVNMHVVNFFLCGVELVLHDIPPRASDVGVVLFFAIAYSIFTVVRVLVVPVTAGCIVSRCRMWESGHLVWPYFFLDTSVPWSPLCYLALVLVQWLFYKIPFAFRTCMERRYSGAKVVPLTGLLARSQSGISCA